MTIGIENNNEGKSPSLLEVKMYIEKPKELFKPCIILPLDEQEGLITRIKYDCCGVELLVRYFMYGSVLHNWFYDFELELKQPKDHNKDFFRG